MNIILRLVTILLLLSGASMYAQDSNASKQHINLKVGDEFVYELMEKRSYITRYPSNVMSINSPGPNDTISRTTRTLTSKLYFKVLDRQDGDCYTLKYRIMYRIARTETDFTHSCSDSRYPSIGKKLWDVVQSFLNNTSFTFKYCPKSGRISMLNIKQIEEKLKEYLDFRNVPDDEYRRNAISTTLNRKRLLHELQFLREMDIIIGENKKITNRNNSEIVTTKLMYKSPDSTSYAYFINNYNMRLDNSFPERKYSLKGSYTVDNRTGLLSKYSYASYLENENEEGTSKLFQQRADIADISGSIVLKYCSTTAKRTWICGKYYLPGIHSVGLTTARSILDGDIEYKENAKDSLGNFAIELNIVENTVYDLHFFSWFPSITPNLKLYLKPGDSIYIERDTLNDKYLFSGRGEEDSELFNKLKLPYSQGMLFRIQHPDNWQSRNLADHIARTKKSIEEKYTMLLNEKSKISEDFFLFINSEYESAFGIMKYYDFWNEFSKEYRENHKPGLNDTILLIPDIPESPDYKFMKEYCQYISTYSTVRYNIFNFQNTGGFPVAPEGVKDSEFVKLLLSGVPLYMNYGNMMVERIIEGKFFTNQLPNDYRIMDFIENCNHQDSRNYISDLLKRKEDISQGSEKPSMNLIEMNGEAFDWKKTEGKIVVMMLYGDYSREHYFAEDLYKKYGENKKDVIILRISPGSSYEKWKSYNEKYSNLRHQMYYTDGQFKFNEQFLLHNKRNSYRYLIIDREGKIYRNFANNHFIKGAIKASLKQAPSPKKPFFETWIGQVLPGIIIGIVITLFLSKIIIRQRQRKRELLTRLTTLEHKAIKAQLNPHFLFNCLNSIQNLIEKNKQKEANDYLLLFAKIIRRILQYSDKEEVAIQDEIETLQIYIDLEMLRFKFDSIIDLDTSIDIYNTMMPPMLLQPIVENAIIHGLEPKEGEKTLRITVYASKGSIIFRIKDNGVGRTHDDQNEIDVDRRGLELVKSRLELMNKGTSNAYSINIIDEIDSERRSEGTTVEIIVPDEK